MRLSPFSPSAAVSLPTLFGPVAHPKMRSLSAFLLIAAALVLALAMAVMAAPFGGDEEHGLERR